MAKLFLSYSRKDETRARRFTEWLEREGHDVWRDQEDIGGGASFSSEIEQALKDCDAVLVLWSAASVQSAWVRDEAAFGRDAGKLIPFSLDGIEPPLGFRQFQSINISRWKRTREPPGGDRIRNAIARIAHLPQAPPGAHVRTRSRNAVRKPLLIGSALAVLAFGVAGIVMWQRASREQEIAIAVQPSPKSPDRAMATDYANVAAADMAAFLPRHFDRSTVIAPAGSTDENAGYRMEIFTDQHGAGANATLTLADDTDAVLWSRNWSVADASAADLRAEVSEFASKAALCLTDAEGGRTRLSQPALGLFLNGCTSLGDTNISYTDYESMFERVLKLSPDFAPAWDYLALVRSWIAEGLGENSPARASALQKARDAIEMARKLNPNSAMSYDAEFHLTDDTFRGLQILQQAAKVDPQDGRIQMHLSEVYQSVGRMSDSVQAAQRGVELEPGSPYTVSQYIHALVYSGQFSKAKSVTADAAKRWPADPQIESAEFGFEFRYGDPRAALALLPRMTDATDAEMASLRKVIAARQDPTQSKIDEAIAALSANKSNSPDTQNRVLLALGGFGRVDRVYQLLDERGFQNLLYKDALFRPDFARVRADPRFIQVAARLGLVRYWRTTGYWPDFCASEKLPYDCKAEAAKYPT